MASGETDLFLTDWPVSVKKLPPISALCDPTTHLACAWRRDSTV